MNHINLETELAKTLNDALLALETANDLVALEGVKNTYMAKKGIFAGYMQTLNALPATERPQFGKIVNQAKAQFQNAFNAKKTAVSQAALQQKLAQETVDITLSGRQNYLGGEHPITLTRKRIEQWFGQLGFVIRTGPEIEDDFHNFTALNVPEHHPARAMQDTFYFDREAQIVLRTQTSNVQIHTLEKESLPLRMIAPGRVYRSDSDATHSPMFHQCEGLVVDTHSTFADLKGLLIHFLRDFFERDDLRIRFRPSFFPFTEPSAEVDIAFFPQENDETNTQWLEVLGCGMVHPNVLKNVGIDSNVYQGYAFGMGIERLAMLRYGITDLRLFFENDLRFLQQFRRER